MILIPTAPALYISWITAYLPPLCPFTHTLPWNIFLSFSLPAFQSSPFTKYSGAFRCLFLLNASMIYLETIIQMLLSKKYKCSRYFSQS